MLYLLHFIKQQIHLLLRTDFFLHPPIKLPIIVNVIKHHGLEIHADHLLLTHTILQQLLRQHGEQRGFSRAPHACDHLDDGLAHKREQSI